MKKFEILRTNLVGRDVSIYYEGTVFKGKITDETKKTLKLKIKAPEREVVIPKIANMLLQIKITPGTLIEINGDKLLGRSEDRLKKRWRNW